MYISLIKCPCFTISSNGKTGFTLQHYSLHTNVRQRICYVNRGRGGVVLGFAQGRKYIKPSRLYNRRKGNIYGRKNSLSEGTPCALTVLIKNGSARESFGYVVWVTGRLFSKPLALFRSITWAHVRRHRHARVRCESANCFVITLTLPVRAVQQMSILRLVTILRAGPSGLAI